MAFSALNMFAKGDEQGKNRWLLEHYLEHRAFADALLKQTPPFAPTDLPIQTMENPRIWLDAHQQVSQSQWTGIGGGQSTDLASVNWDDWDQVLDWFQFHSDWHYQMRTALGL